MPTIEVGKSNKERLDRMRRDTPGKDRVKESFAMVVKRLLDSFEKEG